MDKSTVFDKIVSGEIPKVKPQIQGDAVRVTSSSKDDLQGVMQLLKQKDFDFPLNFTNYR